MFALIVGMISVASWIYLLLGRGYFWLEKPDTGMPEAARWPAVAAVVPARDEAETIGPVIKGLLGQDYPGDFRVLLVDDHSSDGTAGLASSAAQHLRQAERLTVLQAPPLEEGWSGKLWALNAGARYAAGLKPTPEYLLLTDADILHSRGSLRQLVARAQDTRPRSGPYDLVSLMARLNCRTAAEKLMIPAFVFFFEMLYPFRWVNDPRKRTAAAAGGVVLLRREAIEAAGGLAVMRGALIDDCTLAALIKPRGRIRLSLAADTISLRSYKTLGPIWHMVARTAFTQLRHSMLLLAATVTGLSVTYLAPPLLLLSGSMPAAILGTIAWTLMTLAYWPTVRYYRQNGLWALALPLTALIYAAATLDSARRHGAGRGGEWKGRTQAKPMTSDE